LQAVADFLLHDRAIIGGDWSSAAIPFVLARVPDSQITATGLTENIEFFGFVLPNCSFVLGL
jgi:hypothetical protein